MKKKKIILIGSVAILISALLLWLHEKQQLRFVTTSLLSVSSAEPDTIFIDLSKPPVSALSDKLEEVRYVPLQEMEHSMILGMTDLFVDDQHIIVLDKEGQKLVGFDHKGNYIFDVYKKGQKSYEYKFLEAATYDHLTREIIVEGTKKYLRYDFQGNMTASFESPLHYSRAMISLDSSRVGLYTEFRSYTSADLNVLDSLGNLLHGYLPSNTKANFRALTSNYSIFSGSYPQILITPSYSSVVYELGEKERLTKKYFINFGENSLPNNFTNKVLNNDSLSRNELLKFEDSNGWARVIGAVVETDHFVHIPFKKGRDRYYGYYSKLSRKFWYHMTSDSSNDIGGKPFVFQNQSLGNYFLSFVSPQELKESLHNGMIRDNKLIEEIKNISNNSNPIIRFSKLMTF